MEVAVRARRSPLPDLPRMISRKNRNSTPTHKKYLCKENAERRENDHPKKQVKK
jgi:hypothetical protein